MRKAVRGKLCPECGGPIYPGKEEFTFHGTDLRSVRGSHLRPLRGIVLHARGFEGH